MHICTESHTLAWINENFHKDTDYVLSYNYGLVYNNEPLFTANHTEKSPKIFGRLPFYLPCSQGVEFLAHGISWVEESDKTRERLTGYWQRWQPTSEWASRDLGNQLVMEPSSSLLLPGRLSVMECIMSLQLPLVRTNGNVVLPHSSGVGKAKDFTVVYGLVWSLFHKIRLTFPVTPKFASFS